MLFRPADGMGPWTWLWITTVARIPSIVTSTIGGSALGVQNYVFAAIALGVTPAHKRRRPADLPPYLPRTRKCSGED